MSEEILQAINNGVIVSKKNAEKAAEQAEPGSYIVPIDIGELSKRAFTIVTPDSEEGEIAAIKNGGKLVNKTPIPKVIFDAFKEPKQEVKRLIDFC